MQRERVREEKTKTKVYIMRVQRKKSRTHEVNEERCVLN